MSTYDIVIKDGMIFDGTGAPRVRGDVGIAGGKIAAVGRVGAREGDRVIDASGMHIAPGFVDLHTHYDAQVFWTPTARCRVGTASPRWPSATAASASLPSTPTCASTPCAQ